MRTCNDKKCTFGIVQYIRILQCGSDECEHFYLGLTCLLCSKQSNRRSNFNNTITVCGMSRIELFYEIYENCENL